MTPSTRTRCLISALVAFLPACGGGSATGSAGAGQPPLEADLLITSMVFSPVVVDAGSSILATDVVLNTGPEDVPGFRVGVYLSDDPLLDATDLLLGFRTLAGLDAGIQDGGGGELTIPPNTATGTYWVGAVADDLDAVGEPDEGNNALVAVDTLEVSAPLLPNLVPTAVSFTPQVVDAGQAIQVDDLVENQGLATAGSFQVGVYLSSDPFITTFDTLLGVRQISSLGPATGDQGTGTVTIPSTTQGGLYYVGVLADDTDSVVELNELDNGAIAAALLEVEVPPLPDLVPTHVTFTPSAVDAGDEIFVGEGVLNQGVVPAGTFQVAVYLSADPSVDDEDVLLGYRTVGYLDAGATDQVQGMVLKIPPDTPAGAYWVGVLVDDTELIAESVEANNALAALNTLAVDIPPLPNLKPASIEFSPGVINVDLGEPLHVEELIANVGAASAGPFRVGVYLSPNSVLTTSDLLIASRVVTALGPGGATGAAEDVVLPAGLADGAYYVGVIADDLDEQDEIGEGDNLLLATDLVDIVSVPDPQPDLVTTEVTWDGVKKAPGETFQVTTRVTNEGDLSASPFHVGVYLSLDDDVTPDDALIGERYLLGGLSAGFTNVASAPVTIPADQPEATYYLGAFADSKLAVSESDEDDNGLAANGTLEVEAPPPPAAELSVKSSSHDGDVHAAGDTVTIDETIHNTGALSAGTFRVGYYLSDDLDVDVTDVLLASRTIGTLAVGAESSATTPVVLPANTIPGSYWLGIVVDDQLAVQENDEEDNFVAVLPVITVE